MRQFLTTLVVLWMAACIAAYFYSSQQHIAPAVALAVLPAFLLELAFYLASGFAAVRKAFDALGSRTQRAALLAVSAVTPYLMVSVLTGTFRVASFFELAGVALLASFWYARLRRGVAADLLFLAFMAAVYLTKLFDQIYGAPAPHVALAILGRLMWIRLGLIAVLCLRTLDEVQFGFVPSLEDWRIGAQYYLYFLPVGAVLSYLVHFARFHPLHTDWWKFALLLLGTFLGILWVVALAEEFFFRAFLQTLLARSLGSKSAGLIAASALFGLAHLPYRAFPNWRFALLGGVSGIFYGLAFLKARSVRAGMVTHALVVTTWRIFFPG